MDLDRAATAHQAALSKIDEVKRANAARLQSARARAEETRAVLAAAIVEDYLRGTRVGDLARRSKYSRETIRTILRQAGVEAPPNG